VLVLFLKKSYQLQRRAYFGITRVKDADLDFLLGVFTFVLFDLLNTRKKNF